MLYKILVNMPAIVLGLFCGAWSDQVGRKLPIALPCLGTVIAGLFYLMSMIIGHAEVCILIGATIRGVFGKSAVITMALHSYVSDISHREERTHRLGRLLAMNFFGYFVGSLIAGGLLEISGYELIFYLVITTNLFIITITISCMPESLPEHSTSGDKIKTPFKLANVKDSLRVLVRSREGRTRCHIVMLFLTTILNQVCKSGEVDIILLFVERNPLHWRRSMYGYLLALDYASMGLAAFVFIPVLTKLLHFSDLTIVQIGVACKVLRLIVVAFSSTTWMVYASVVIGAPSSFIVSGTKSLISKQVEEEEIGKTFSLLSSGEVVSNLIGSVIFTNLYAATVHLYPGFMFTMDSVFWILMLMLLICLARDMRLSSHYKLMDDLAGESVNKNKESGVDAAGAKFHESSELVTTSKPCYSEQLK